MASISCPPSPGSATPPPTWWRSGSGVAGPDVGVTKNKCIRVGYAVSRFLAPPRRSLGTLGAVLGREVPDCCCGALVARGSSAPVHIAGHPKRCNLMSFVLRPPILQRYEEAVIFLEWLSQQYSSQMDSLRHELALKASTSARRRRERCYVETAGSSGYPTFRIAILALHPSFQAIYRSSNYTRRNKCYRGPTWLTLPLCVCRAADSSQ